MTRPMKIEAIDLFCGAGGLTRGLIDAGVTVKAGFDIDAACRFAYEENNPGASFYSRDITTVTGGDLDALWTPGAVRLLAGCAPCQPFSAAANAVRLADPDMQADAYDLLDHFGRLVFSCRPELVTMENVPRVLKHAPFHRFVQRLRDCKYHVWFESVDCQKVGVPQRRRRMVLLASRLGEMSALTTPKAVRAPTVAEVIGELPQLDAGQKDANDAIHFARAMTPINISRIRASKPGGTWRDWPMSLRSACHTKATGQSYANVYARMDGAKTSPTITTQFYNFGTGRFGHPTQDRGLTPREAALLQSFPANYKFVKPGEPVYLNALGRLIGNAVPPLLGKAIGETMVAHAVKFRPAQPAAKRMRAKSDFTISSVPGLP